MKNNRYIAAMVGLLLMMGASTTAYGQIVKGKVFGGGQLAQVNGQATKVNGDAADAACSVTISSGDVYGEVFGAGEGLKSYEANYHADVAKVTGDTKVHLGTGRGGGGTAWRDIFGGGALAKVQGDTYVSMAGGHIAANLFGGGMGDIKMNGTVYDRSSGSLQITSADITGNTNVDITGGDIIWNRTSSTTTTDNSKTTYTYTKTFAAQTGQSATEERETNDQQTAIKESYESQGYTDVTVGEPSGTEAPYTYAVTYTIPGYTLVVTSDTKRTDLEGYTETPIVEDNSTVEGEIVWWNPDENVADGATDSKGNKCFNSKFYDATKKKFLIKHNIFGGGYIACRVGTYNASGEIQNKKDGESNDLLDAEGNVIPTGRARVSMVSGMFGADLMGTQQWKDCYNDNQDPHFYVFGGGFGAYTSVGKTQVQIGVNEEILEAAGETDEQWAKPHNRLANNARPKRVIGGTPEDPEIGIADNSYGEPGYTVLGVLGGGYAGIVTGNTDVRVGGNTFMHRIYGGGYGQLAAYNELVAGDNICKGIPTWNISREDLGMVKGNTYVKTDGGFVQGDVFGGGAGVESAWLDGTTYKELDGDHTTAVKDFTMGEVKGVTEVEITGATFVQRSVYGGGDVANVLGGTVGTGENDPKQTSTVTVKGGTVVASVFGGGNGRLVSQVTPGSVSDNTVTVGTIFGNTLVTVEDIKDAETDEIISSPYIYGDIYGGCGYGQIKVHSTPAKGAGNTYVNINGGNIGGNVYGGGLGKEPEVGNVTSANIAGTTNVTINGGKALWDKISDDNGNISKWDVVENILTTDAERTSVRLALVTGDTQIFKTLLAGKVSDKFFDVEKLEYTKNHNIYGGGDRVCKVAGTANVTINHALVTDATILDPNNSAGLCWVAGIDNKEHPQFSVFGGGYGPNTTVANTVVKYQCGKNEITYSPEEATEYNTEHAAQITAGTLEEVKAGDHKADYTYESQDADRKNWLLYFGGLAQNWAALDSKEKDDDYGGNNQAGIWRYAVSQLAWSSGIPNLIMRGVFGGGYAGLVSRNTDVTVSDFSCLRYVYGGGLGSKDYLTSYVKDDRNNLYNRLGEVGGNSTVVISGGVVSKEVYGGGAGIEPKKLNGEENDYTDLVDMARVKGKTSVIVSGSPSVTEEGTSGTVIIGDLFGGGDVANVGMEDAAITGTTPNDDDFVTSKVIINSGCMLGQVFAGGNGRTKELCSGADRNGVFGYQKVGAIYGNTLLTVNGYDESSSEGQGGSHNNITYIFKRMFGGGNNGSIRKTTDEDTKDYSGHTYVTVNGGYFAYNVFGGGVGTINTTVNEETGETIDNNTYSYVEGSTHVKMLGGLAIVDQYWDKPQTIQIAPDKTIEIGLRQWAPLNEKDGKKYSAQYDPDNKKLLINHNVYAGCRNAGYVLGNTYLTMNKGYIRSGLRAGAYEGVADNFFESQEWEQIYSKIGSPHFCIFGGGFGENTHIKGDTYVDIDIDATDENLGLTSAEVLKETDHDKPAAHRFEGGQSVMDIIGGGYSGDVAGATHVKVSHDVYARRIFGGSFYAPVSQTNIMINSINCDDIFGGGMMGDVKPTTVKGYTLGSGAGNTNVVIGTPDAEANAKIFINNNVYGGNDVSGEVTGQINASIFGGKIYNNVYGAGNGNYLYALNDKVQKVTAHEYYEANGQTYELVYEVPKRAKMDFSVTAATDAQKIVNINTYRPMAENVVLNICGTSSKPLSIDGNVFGGGNTATVSSLSGNRPSVTVNIGSNCTIGGVYMGADGEEMFQEKSGFMGAFQNINGVDLTNPIDWVNNVANKQISEEFLPVAKANRNKVYPHVLDLYFEPVEMSVQPTLNWCSGINLKNAETLEVNPKKATQDKPLGNTTIGVFVCGGNRGNMNVEPWNGTTANYGGNVEEAGQIINYEFPKGLTITNRIVGGCNEANYTLGKVTHVGGYLLGGREHDGTEIKLLVECQFAMPQGMTSLLSGGKPLTDSEGNPVEQRNVYGGCYKSGTIYGDINIDFRSSMLTTDNLTTKNADGDPVADDPVAVAKAYFSSEVAMGNVYGAGYGPESYVYGDTKVTVNPNPVYTSTPAKGVRNAQTPPVVDNKAYAAMSVYGGGQQGNVIGNTTVRILNGHLGKSAVGGSYAGYMWGSTQVLVGYPSYYTAQQGGKYKMLRADKWNVGDDYKNHDGSDVVKQEIYLMPGDIVSEEVFNAIAAYDAKNSTSQATTGNGAGNNFSAKVTETPAGDWDDINITIDEAAYGGGYSLASGSSVAAGTYTVKKYDTTMNLDGDYNMSLLTAFVNDVGNNTTKDYGGNSTVLVWDNNDTDQSRDHIKISTQTMKDVTDDLKEDADLFGYYVAIKDAGGNIVGYKYIYEEDTYFFTKDASKDDAQYFKQAYESDSEGGIFGDGHLSFVQGFRTGELVGYGFAGYRPNSALVINTFQRMDILRIKDCAVVVLGARDYTVNEVSTTPYSIARIGELHMEAENVTNAFGNKFMTEGGNLSALSAPHSRNYLGLSNNIHYLGAVNSNIDFNATYHNGNKNGDANNGKPGSNSYRKTKQDYIDSFNHTGNSAEFQERNDGTAANMIGISSGYAMKVQNVKTTDAKGKEEHFYGPIVGVVEMNLIDVREDEGGGYVYADNIHHRDATLNHTANYDNVPVTKVDTEDFLETSGNFVFPYDEKRNRYIVDDCFDTGFDERTDNTKATAEAHYWYVTGYNYYYNAHITGYTYDTSTTPLIFNSDKDNLMTLAGAKVGQQITLQSLKWHKKHTTKDGFVQCDLETDATAMATACTDETVKGNGNTASSTDGDHFIYDHYNLFVGTANAEGKYAVSQEVTPENGTDLSNGGYYIDEACTTPATGTADGLTKYYQNTMSYWANLPLTANLAAKSNRVLTNTLSKESPTLAFQLKDNVDNSGNEYFQKYMAQPCDATVVLTCPATDKNGDRVKGYVPISFFFNRSADPDASGNYTYTKLTDGTGLSAGTTYYYFGNGNDYHDVNSNDLLFYDKTVERYVPVNKSAFTYAKYIEIESNKDMTLTEYNALPTFSGTLESGSQEHTFYAYADRTYTYTIYLTIDYVQGPDVSGNIKIYNCALPGEKIKIDKGTVTISSDVSMSQESTIWQIGEWRFDQAHPYDPTADVNTTDEMLKDVEYSEQDNCIYVPAYYFMNGYPVQYRYTVNGIPDEFFVPANENGQDKLTIHNYHRMKPRNADGVNRAPVDFKLDEALKRIKAETKAANDMPETTEEERTAKAEALKAILPEPRIYIADAADLNELPRFISEKEVTAYYTLAEYNTAKSKTLTADEFYALPEADRVKTYGDVGSKYDFGNHMQFHLLNDIVVNDVGLSNLQGDHYADKGEATNFKGTLNGNGYVISDLGVKNGEFTAPTYLFAANSGNIYNLGLKQGVITKGDAPVNETKYPLYHTSYTWSNKTVYRMDGTAVGTTADDTGNSYTENDWRYGKVTYDLNQYYLEARKAVLNSATDAQHYVEDLFHNGDYLYARWKTASSEYLRTADASIYDANYNSATSYHYYSLTDGVLTHPVDESRAVYDESVFSHYAPLYETAKQNSTSATSETVKNDFLFFGQKLNAATKKASTGEINVTIPEHIDSDVKHDVSLMNNRVYRAGGYYKSNVSYWRNNKKPEDRYDTSGDAFFYNRAAYAHDNGVTAIDFYGYKDPTVGNYNPVVDYPTAKLASMDRADGVTRNLLVYANSAADVAAADQDNSTPAGILRDKVYAESTVESNVKMHVINPKRDPSGDVKAETELFHLVERTAEDKDASGGVCLNNDFDCPVAFDVTDHAWYVRVPAGYRNRKPDERMWEGIVLPFTAKTVTAILQKERQGREDEGIKANGMITHFYGNEDQHHEYWLRVLTAVGSDGATFCRPGDNTTELFKVTQDIEPEYTFINDYFAKLSSDLPDEFKDKYNTKPEYGEYYEGALSENGGQKLSNYVYLTKEIPYIVAFPGNDYYEFSMEGDVMYDVTRNLSAEGSHHKSGMSQYARFEAPTATIQVSADNAKTTKVGTTNQTNHIGTYLAMNDADYAINGNGNAFDDDVEDVLPFRTYMTKTAGGAAPHRIYILENSDNGEDGDNDDDMRPAQDMPGKSLSIEVEGLNVIVHSTFDDVHTVNVYRVNGQLVHIHKAPTGESTFTLPGEGLYIINGKKIAVKD